MVGITVTLTTLLFCFLLITSAKRMNRILPIKRPLDLAWMSYPSRSDCSCLKKDVRYIELSSAVCNTNPDGDRFNSLAIVFRTYLCLCFREKYHRPPPLIQINETALCCSIFIFDYHFNADLRGI